MVPKEAVLTGMPDKSVGNVCFYMYFLPSLMIVSFFITGTGPEEAIPTGAAISPGPTAVQSVATNKGDVDSYLKITRRHLEVLDTMVQEMSTTGPRSRIFGSPIHDDRLTSSEVCEYKKYLPFLKFSETMFGCVARGYDLGMYMHLFIYIYMCNRFSI